METRPYTALVARKAASSKGKRPAQGTHLLSLRKAAGLTQIELAEFLGVSKANIAFWEWNSKPPRSEILPKMARAFAVRVDEILLGDESKKLTTRPGPIGEVQKTFEEIRQLPRKQQRKIIETVRALLNEYNRKAS